MVKKQSVFYLYLVFLIMIICSVSFMSCGKKQSVIIDQDNVPKKNIPRENTYRKIVIQNFEADNILIQNRPDALALCENATLSELLKISSVPMIVKTAPKSIKEMNTIVVKVYLTFLSVRGKSQNIGNKITAQLRLIDASTGKTVHEKYISLADPSASASPGIYTELGKSVARHVEKFVRGR